MKNLKYVCCIIFILIIIIGCFSTSNAVGACSKGGVHNYVWTVYKAATCTSTGTERKTCTKCGGYIDVRTISAKGHNYKAATCTKPKTCTRCGATSGKALGHNYSWNLTPATCTKAGSKTQICSRCKAKGKTETIAKLGHSYNAATCTKPKTCKYCGATSGSALGHKYGVYIVDSATYHARTCSVCKNKQQQKHNIVNGQCTVCYYKASTPGTQNCTHGNWTDWTITKAATCTVAGSKKRTCRKCDYVEFQTIPATGHSYKVATCTSPKTCTKCGATSGSALGHKYGAYVVDTATYHARTCSVCKNKQQEKHNIVNGQCTVCYYKANTPGTQNCTHGNWTDWTITKAATCTVAGSKKRTCRKCDYVEFQTIPATGHSYGNWLMETIEYHIRKCNNCGASQTEKHTLDKNGKCTKCTFNKNNFSVTSDCSKGGDHTFAWRTTKQATCTEKGARERYCTKCGTVIEKGIIEATGHSNWTNWVTVTEPTCKKEGQEKRSCRKCDYVETRSIPKIDHTFDGTYESNEVSHSRKCVVCGTVLTQKHKVINYSNEIPATCMAEGEKFGICSICGRDVVEKQPKVSHKYDSKAGYSSDYKLHYTHCIYCDSVNPKGEAHKWGKGDETGVCTVCGYQCKHSTYDSHGNCTICGYVNKDICDGNHVYEMKKDFYGHYETCIKCGYKNAKNSGLHKYKTDKDGKQQIIDLCNGKHGKTCTECGYEFTSVHLYINCVCISCGAKNTTGIQYNIEETMKFDPNNIEDVKDLQEHLKDMGYYSDEVDGKMGPNTRTAILEMLSDKGSSRGDSLPKNFGWDDITPEMFTLLMTGKETKIEAKKRIDSANRREARKEREKVIKELYESDDPVIQACLVVLEQNRAVGLSIEDDEFFNEVIIYCLSSNNTYSMEGGKRETGWEKTTEFFENPSTAFDIDEKVNFDCSAFASTVMKLAYGISCTKEDGVSPYSTPYFNNNGTDFTKVEYSKDNGNTKIDINSLQKGQMILAIDDNGVDHIMVYVGGGYIVHSNGTYDEISFSCLNEGSPDYAYTDQFTDLNAEGCDYETLYVLTPVTTNNG